MNDIDPSTKNGKTSRVMTRTWNGIMWLLAIVAFLVVSTTSSRPQVGDQNRNIPDITEDSELELEVSSREVDDFSLIERSGERVTKQDLIGKPWVVHFIFTNCAATCPSNMRHMTELAGQCEDVDVRFVTITVDPERDTPERLKQYAEIYTDDEEGWLFLTGERGQIWDLILHSFMQVVEEKDQENRLLGYEYAHSDRALHIDENGVILGQYYLPDPEERVLLRQVLAGERETPADNAFIVPANYDSRANDSKNAEIAAQFNQAQQKSDAEDEAAEVDETKSAPTWLTNLPAINASLNSLATLLLIIGFALIKSGNRIAHRNVMLSAFAVSVAFLACYLTYHFGLKYYTGESSKTFPDLGFIRQVYLTILISHILLAVPVPVLALVTIYQGLRSNWQRHRFWARITFPIWLYVSVTGVVIYVMLYEVAGV